MLSFISEQKRKNAEQVKKFRKIIIGLPDEINKCLNLLKRHLRYYQSDHILNIAYNNFTGVTCLEEIEPRRNNESYLNALGAKIIPDPTSTGDFLLRFKRGDVIDLMDAKISIRRLVWLRQSQNFKRQSTIYSDGTINQPPAIVKMAWLFPMPDSGAIIPWWYFWPIQENPFLLSTVPEISRPIAVHRCELIIAKILYPISLIKSRYGETEILGKEAIQTVGINIAPLFLIWDAQCH